MTIMPSKVFVLSTTARKSLTACVTKRWHQNDGIHQAITNNSVVLISRLMTCIERFIYLHLCHHNFVEMLI